MKINIRKLMRGLWICLILGTVAGGMTSCEKEPIGRYECERITGFDYEPTESGRYRIHTITIHETHIVRIVGYTYWLEVVGGQHFEWCGERY
tara:strand:- start:514 stop:789 length:276 start_codon:yes stop_codon:yes gene_type:complete